MPLSDAFFLEKLSVKNFRNHPSSDIDLGFQLVFFIGENGVGKTGLLEAISLASILRSFRTRSSRDMISWNEQLYTIDLEYSDREKRNAIHIGYGMQANELNRSLIFNGKKIDRVVDFIGKFQTVFFSPNDMQIIDTTPAERRRFFDMLLSSLYPDYLKSLQDYQRILRIRSVMLRRGDSKKVDLTFFRSLDKQVAEKGALLQRHRQTFFQGFQGPFDEYVGLISGGDEAWRLRYEPSIKGGDSEEQYKSCLEKKLSDDLQQKKTSQGIHRDQIKLLLKHPEKNDLDLREAASQGQKRTVALALKMAQYAYTKEKMRQTPVLLIDDVLNELDITRRARFIEFLNDTGQALITTTDLFGMEEFIRQKKDQVSLCIYKLKNHSDRVVIEPEST